MSNSRICVLHPQAFINLEHSQAAMECHWMSVKGSFTIVLALAIILSYNFTNARKDMLRDTNWTPAVKLENILPDGYDSMQAPRLYGRPTNVSVRIVILNIRSVDVSEMSYVADIFLYKRWTDERLQFPDSPEEKIAMNTAWREHIWTPDIFFLNAIEGHIHQTIIPCMYLWLQRDKTIDFGARLSLEFSCDMTLKAFPHDSQECHIIIMSLTHTVDQMDLKWEQTENNDGLEVGDLIVLPQFEISDLDTKKFNSEYKLGTFSCLRGIIKLNRRVGYYIINIYIPTILIVFMSMLTFWIPPEAVPARVTLGVTSLLTIVTKQYTASLPSVSYVVALNIWLSCCIAFVFCSLMEYAVVIAMITKYKRIEAKASKRTARGDEEQKLPSEGTDPVVPVFDPVKIDRVSRIVFPLLFVSQAILYWIVYAPVK